MGEQKKKILFAILVVISSVVLLIVGSTFAYFSAVVSSNENAIVVGAATFELDLDDDVSLIKDNLIPSIEEYVDIASTRVSNGEFIKPYENQQTGETVIDGTACVDDNLNNICSIYTFTVINEMTNTDVPLYITLIPAVNTFENLYIKILDENKQEVVNSKMQVLDDRYETEVVNGVTKYQKSDGEWVQKDDFANLTMSPYVLTPLNNILPRATVDDQTGYVIPSTVTYSIVMWIMETGYNQNLEDSNKMFAAQLKVSASGAEGNGITGVISAVGNENP